jgi:RNA polymerase sigma-70 factor (ECF subfamily)
VKENLKKVDLEKEFINLIKKNESIILKICNIYCKEIDDRQDLYQDILVQLWKSFPKFDKRAKISTWMYRIAFNTAVSRYRLEKKKSINEEISDQLISDNSNEDENVRLLYGAIDGLDKIDKAITLLYMDGTKYKEIGEIMGLSESNVGFKINQIKRKLREKLKIDIL